MLQTFTEINWPVRGATLPPLASAVSSSPMNWWSGYSLFIPVTSAASTARSVSVTTSVMLDLNFVYKIRAMSIVNIIKIPIFWLLWTTHTHTQFCLAAYLGLNLLVIDEGLSDSDTGIADKWLHKWEHLPQGLFRDCHCDSLGCHKLNALPDGHSNTDIQLCNLFLCG